jgi:hypothetical protein
MGNGRFTTREIRALQSREGRFEQTPGYGGITLDQARSDLKKLVEMERTTGNFSPARCKPAPVPLERCIPIRGQSGQRSDAAGPRWSGLRDPGESCCVGAAQSRGRIYTIQFGFRKTEPASLRRSSRCGSSRITSR